MNLKKTDNITISFKSWNITTPFFLSLDSLIPIILKFPLRGSAKKVNFGLNQSCNIQNQLTSERQEIPVSKINASKSWTLAQTEDSTNLGRFNKVTQPDRPNNVKFYFIYIFHEIQFILFNLFFYLHKCFLHLEKTKLAETINKQYEVELIFSKRIDKL